MTEEVFNRRRHLNSQFSIINSQFPKLPRNFFRELVIFLLHFGKRRAIIPRVSESRAEIGMSPSGKAPDFDSGIRRFKSCHPSHFDPLAQLAEQLPFKQWVWSSNLQRVTKKADTPWGVCFFTVPGRFERSNRNSPADCCSPGRAPATHLFPEGMQTNLQRVTKKADTPPGVSAFLLFPGDSKDQIATVRV